MNDIWFLKCHRAHHVTEISLDILCMTCYDSGHITMEYTNMELPRCQFCTGLHMRRNKKCGVVMCRGRTDRLCTYTAAKYVNSRESHYAISKTCPVWNLAIFLVFSGKEQ